MKLTPEDAAYRAKHYTYTPPPQPTVETMPFDEFLAMMAPNDPAPKRLQLFRTFFADYYKKLRLRTNRDADPEIILAVVMDNQIIFQSEGIPPGKAREFVEKFPIWRAEHTSAERSRVAKEAAAKRADAKIETARIKKAARAKPRRVKESIKASDWDARESGHREKLLPPTMIAAEQAKIATNTGKTPVR